MGRSACKTCLRPVLVLITVQVCRGLPGHAYSTTNHPVHGLHQGLPSTGFVRRHIHTTSHSHTPTSSRFRCFASSSGMRHINISNANCGLFVAAYNFSQSTAEGLQGNWDIKMLYDGDCPLCMREVNMLRKRDKDQNKIGFVDISSPDYSSKDNAGISYEQVSLVSTAFANGMPPTMCRCLVLPLLHSVFTVHAKLCC